MDYLSEVEAVAMDMNASYNALGKRAYAMGGDRIRPLPYAGTVRQGCPRNSQAGGSEEEKFRNCMNLTCSVDNSKLRKYH